MSKRGPGTVVHRNSDAAGGDPVLAGTRPLAVAPTNSRKGRRKARELMATMPEVPAPIVPREGRRGRASDLLITAAPLPSAPSISADHWGCETQPNPVGGSDGQSFPESHPGPAVASLSASQSRDVSLSPGAGEGGGQGSDDARELVAPATNSSGQILDDNPCKSAAGGEGQSGSVPPPPIALADLIAEVVDTHRQRRSLLIAEGDMTRRIKSKERWASVYRYRANGLELPKGKFPPVSDDDIALVAKLFPSFYEARSVIEKQRKEVEKRLLKMAAKLPLAGWCENVRGFGLLSLAAIVGEAGDLSKYANPAKLWKRMGLAVFDGKSQRRVTDAEQAIKQGYSPQRRSVMFMIGDSFIKTGNEEYRAIYDTRKAYELARAPDMKPIIAHRRAKRYIEKRFLLNLWKAWRATNRATPMDGLPAEIQDAAD